MKSRAFTLIELLVVIAIIAILAAILFPVFAQAKAAAKRTADLSNVKNITLGMMVYTGDADDSLPPIQQGVWPSSDNDRYSLILWKDAILPYIKNGGKYMKPDGTAYTGATNRDGGVFASPTWSGSWAKLPSSQGGDKYGDTTTRFPRSYSVNQKAGTNEGIIRYNSDGTRAYEGLWPQSSWWPWEQPHNNGNSGSMTALDNPAGTMLIGPTRDPYPNIYPQQLCFGCDGNDCDVVDKSVTVVRSVGNKLLNVGFFDGHAKAVDAYRSLDDDIWDEFKDPNYSMDAWPGRKQIKDYMRGYKVWQ